MPLRTEEPRCAFGHYSAATIGRPAVVYAQSRAKWAAAPSIQALAGSAPSSLPQEVVGIDNPPSSGAYIAAAVIENGTTLRAHFWANAKFERSIDERTAFSPRVIGGDFAPPDNLSEQRSSHRLDDGADFEGHP
jgi:hypothetical protein